MITTVAGTGIPGYTGDGGLAVEATLSQPYGIAVSAAGEVYYTEYNKSVVRKIDVTGAISTIAGTGTPGYDLDGVAATTARLRLPTSIAIDRYGNVYVADAGNNRVRKVDISGIIKNIAGNGLPGYLGDNGPAIDAEFKSPIAVAVDSNINLYVTDWANSRIRYIRNVVAVEAISKSDEVTVFPNPSKGDLYIKLPPSNTGEVSIKLTDLFGRTIEEFHETGNGGRGHIQISCAPGIYLLSVSSGVWNVMKQVQIIQ
jgi:sugar lactone lactonase YvrE